MNIVEKTIEYYYTLSGKAPFREWFCSLKNEKDQSIIRARMARIRLGNMGDCSPVGDGVYELRIHVGPGYRIYFGLAGQKIVLLLLGGTKKSQAGDIVKSKIYWADYRRRSK